MDPLLVQRTRYLIKSRFRRPQTCPANLMPSACAQLITWLEAHSILAANLSRLRDIETNATTQVAEILKMVSDEPYDEVTRNYDASSLDAHASICLRIVDGVAALSRMRRHNAENALLSLASYLLGEQVYKLEEAIDAIRDVALDGLFEYLDERLDSDSAIYAILLKYKQRCEWFYKKRVRGYAEEGLEGKTGERALAVDLYDYILSQGVDFIIEQTSASGEVDLVLRDSEERKLVIDAKYLAVETNRSAAIRKLSDGFHQVARYCNDYAESSGFLVTFLATSKRISLDLQQRDGLEFIDIGGKTVYFLPIYIGDEPSASKSGKAEEIAISRGELIVVCHP